MSGPVLFESPKPLFGLLSADGCEYLWGDDGLSVRRSEDVKFAFFDEPDGKSLEKAVVRKIESEHVYVRGKVLEFYGWKRLRCLKCEKY